MAQSGELDAVLQDEVGAALADVHDPEMPALSLIDLGMVQAVAVVEGRARVELCPTFVGCPALEVIRAAVQSRVGAVSGVLSVDVAFVLDPPWTAERITAAGREKLRLFGIAAPGAAPGGEISLLEVPCCPYCGSANTHLDNLFGPTACRFLCYCDDCRNPFEAMKPV